MTSWDLRQDDDVKLFGLELKSKDIDQTDWQIQNTQFQDSLSETCNVRIWKLKISRFKNHLMMVVLCVSWLPLLGSRSGGTLSSKEKWTTSKLAALAHARTTFGFSSAMTAANQFRDCDWPASRRAYTRVSQSPMSFKIHWRLEQPKVAEWGMLSRLTSIYS